jgi:two-component system phosphate regulon response regulator OmpR
MTAAPATILLVDDDDALREELASFLVSAGYMVRDVSRGDRALAELRRHRPDLIITDVMMPGEDGIGLLRERQQLAPDVPVIVITGGSMRAPGLDVTRIAEMMGAQLALSKPFPPQALLDAVAGILARRA